MEYDLYWLYCNDEKKPKENKKMDMTWISVDEKMPKEGETVLVYDGYDYFTAWWWEDEGWYSNCEDFNPNLAPIVKWMDFPKI